MGNSSKPVRIAVQITPAKADFADLRRAALAADDLGADAIYNWDHFHPLGKDTTGKHFEAWTTLGAWAETTTRADLGTLVSAVSYRNPDLLADMARTVDHISGGRLVLGIGTGFREWEAREYGYDFGSPAQRADELADALARIDRRLAALNPPPTRKIPILVAADGPKALRLVARHADIWHTFADGEALAEKSRRLATFCAEIGRDSTEISRSAFVDGDPWQSGPELRKHGVDTFTVMTHGPTYPLDNPPPLADLARRTKYPLIPFPVRSTSGPRRPS